MSPEASLAQAEAARREQERKHETSQAAKDRIERLIAENHLAGIAAAALGIYNGRDR